MEQSQGLPLSLEVLLPAGISILVLLVLLILVVVSMRRQAVWHRQFFDTLRSIRGGRRRPSRSRAASRAMPSAASGLPDGLVLPPGTDALLAASLERGAAVDTVTERPGRSLAVAGLIHAMNLLDGLSPEQAGMHFMAGLVYDSGFLELDPAILRARRITEEQFELLKLHTVADAIDLDFVPEEQRRFFLEAASMHHENCDGSGYPQGLRQKAIPRLARQLRLVESYLALKEPNSYRRGYAESDIWSILGKPQYDQACLGLLRRVLATD